MLNAQCRKYSLISAYRIESPTRPMLDCRAALECLLQAAKQKYVHTKEPSYKGQNTDD
jgi:hypothetical protein